MHTRPQVLHNHATIEQWPAWLLRGRGNHDARRIAHADWVLRRKRDGRYLASLGRNGVQPLVPRLADEAGLAEALEHARALGDGPLPAPRAHGIRMLQACLDRLGLDADTYATRTGLSLVAEPDWLQLAGTDRYRRPL